MTVQQQKQEVRIFADTVDRQKCPEGTSMYDYALDPRENDSRHSRWVKDARAFPIASTNRWDSDDTGNGLPTNDLNSM